MGLYDSYCLGLCAPALIISLSNAINDITKVAVYDENNKLYCDDAIKFAYSLDGVCWSNYGNRDLINQVTSGLDSDFFVKIKINNVIGNVQLCNKDINYSVTLDSGFTFGTTCDNNPNIYSPYSNMETAVALQLQLVDYVSCITGIPIYYFRVTPNAESKDLTFKEYCLLNVSDVKQIKLIISDGLMPSSKPEFSEFGIDFLTDWETYISKSTFATAFGANALPMEHDFIYIPMMQRMWMVNSAYEEKKDAFMWNSAYFTVMLVKYQEKESIDLGDLNDFVASLVTSKYELLFGEDENIDSGESTTTAPVYNSSNLYYVFESDAVRKQASIDTIEFIKINVNLKAIKLSSELYLFSNLPATIVYLHLFCGNEGACSFLIKPMLYNGLSNNIINIGNISLRIEYDKIVLENNEDIFVNILNEQLYFVYLRWSLQLNIIEFVAAENTHPQSIPLYKLKPFHYYFNIDEPYSSCIHKYDIEMIQDNKQDVWINNFNGLFGNFKLFNKYIDSVQELMQQYPNNSNLIINDTARKFVNINGHAL